MQNGTTYIVRPRMQPPKSPDSVSRSSCGSIQLFVGTGVLLLGGSDVGAALDPGDVADVGVRPVAVGPLGFRQPRERALVDEQLAEAVVLFGRPVTPFHVVRLGERSDLIHPLEKLSMARRRHVGRGSFQHSR